MTVASRIVLDTGPLGKISHPRPNREIANWLERLLREGAIIYIPEIADYEVRRELIRAGLQESVNRLDRLKSVLNYLPINTDVMLKAAQLWAQARNRGTPTADPKRSMPMSSWRPRLCTLRAQSLQKMSTTLVSLSTPNTGDLSEPPPLGFGVCGPCCIDIA